MGKKHREIEFLQSVGHDFDRHRQIGSVALYVHDAMERSDKRGMKHDIGHIPLDYHHISDVFHDTSDMQQMLSLCLFWENPFGVSEEETRSSS